MLNYPALHYIDIFQAMLPLNFPTIDIFTDIKCLLICIVSHLFIHLFIYLFIFILNGTCIKRLPAGNSNRLRQVPQIRRITKKKTPMKNATLFHN